MGWRAHFTLIKISAKKARAVAPEILGKFPLQTGGVKNDMIFPEENVSTMVLFFYTNVCMTSSDHKENQSANDVKSLLRR